MKESEEEKGRERGRTEDSEWSDDELGRGVELPGRFVQMSFFLSCEDQIKPKLNERKGNK
jgi:hypothetical protein